MGLFGGIKDALSGINTPGDNGTSFVERLSALGSVMQGDNDAMLKMLEIGKGRSKEAQRAKALAALSDALGPQYAVDNAPIVQRTERAPVPELNELNMPGLSPRAEAPAPYAYQPPQRLPQRTLRDPQVQQALLGAGLGGLGTEANFALNLLKETAPKLAFAPNDMGVDENDPANIGKSFARSEYINGYRVTPNDPSAPSFLPKLPDGTIPDGRGGVVNIPGLATAISQQEGAKARGAAPYEFETYKDGQGREVRAAKSTMAGGAFAGQTAEEAAFSTSRGQGLAANLKDMEASAPQLDLQLGILNDAKKYLDDGAITGFGADVRLQGERALALIGDEKAKKRVAATETFQAVMASRVLDLVKQLGTGSGISNADRDFATKVAGGQIELNRETIDRLIDIQKRQIHSRREALDSARRSAPGASRSSGSVRTSLGRSRIVGVE